MKIKSVNASTSIEEDPPPSSGYISQKAGSPKRHPAFFFVQNFTLPLDFNVQGEINRVPNLLTRHYSTRIRRIKRIFVGRVLRC